MNVAVAAFALVLFQLVAIASGRLDVAGGLGWDGAMYARMVSGHLSDGTANTAVRPLVVLAVRVPYSLGLDVLTSFQVINALSAFILYFVASLLLERGGLDGLARGIVVANLALTISVSKMFGYYPPLIDLGALAVIATAFYLAVTDRWRMAAVACVCAAASREFGLAAVLLGVHRALRAGRWKDAALFVPALLVPVLIRVPALGILPPGGAPLSIGRLATNLRMWAHLPFVTTFAYFSITLLGGLTVLLLLRLDVVVARLRKQPELATFIGFVAAATAAGDADIPRYLVFVLPAALVLVGDCLRDLGGAARLRLLAGLTLITVLTQRPLQVMTTEAYFMDWYPLYRIPAGAAPPHDVLVIWIPRLLLLVLEVAAAGYLLRHALRVRPVYA